MSKLHVIKASAGSGKTHYLTGFFLRQLIWQVQPDYFKQILAVTFTNKATEEMKSRLVEELAKLASDQPSDYIALLSSTSLPEKQVREKAGIILKRILHEYSWFSIETIDTFFQRVIRVFTRELGIPGNYAIELDNSLVLDYAVDQLVDGLGDDRDLLNWLTRFAEDKILEGKSWDFRRDLLELGNELFRENFSCNAENIINAIADRKKMKEFRDELLKRRGRFESICSAAGREALELINSWELEETDFYQKKNGAVKIFRKLVEVDLTASSGEIFTSLKVVEKLLQDPSEWAAADSARKQEVIDLAREKLFDLLHRAVDFVEKEYKDYFTIQVLLQNLYSLGILVDLSGKVRQYRYEKNTFILSDAPVLIGRLINQNDTPFIYEKMGSRYVHFLIDEFQDTSSLQWHNFKPLISNALSQGNECLVVGDAKQSIYRWRNGDWEILARKIFNEYPSGVISETRLETNWRSAERIVSFNSLLFTGAISTLRTDLQDRLAGSGRSFSAELDLLGNIYGDVIQKTAEIHKGRGEVSIQFFSKKDTVQDPEYYRKPLIDTINGLLQQGYGLKDIAILVRDKKKGRNIADFLIRSNSEGLFIRDIGVISDESLLLSASLSVNVLIAALKFLNDEREKIFRAELLSAFLMQKTSGNTQDVICQEWTTHSCDNDFHNVLPAGFLEETEALRNLPLYETVERIISILQLAETESNLAYIHAFLDLVHEFIRKDAGTIDGFLEFWEEQGSSRSITAADSLDAVRILTIHKSKGLEFGAVIIPFCNWSFNQKSNSIFWVNVPEEYTRDIHVFPANYSGILRNTVFGDDYYSEMYRSYIDNLNLLYVALTRAIDHLTVFPVYSDAQKAPVCLNTVGDLMHKIIVHTGTDTFLNYYNQENKTFRIGSDHDHAIPGKAEAVQSVTITSGRGISAMDRLFFGPESYQYFEKSYSPVLERQVRGKVLHGILAGIITGDDLDDRVQHALSEGLIDREEGELLKQHINKALEDPIIRTWFDGSGLILNESDILIKKDTSRRPDRVIIWPGKTHVVDYKFGNDRDEKQHRRQMKGYIELLRKMEYKAIQGFLWYIDMMEVVPVE